MLNIVIPMAGRGSRFAQAGYAIPKPLIPLGGRPMIQWVIKNVAPHVAHRFIFICQEAHLSTFPEVPATLRTLAPGCEVRALKTITEGAACTVLTVEDLIDSDDALLIANSDQYVDIDVNDFLSAASQQRSDGAIMTFTSNDPKWSYCKCRPDGTVSEVVEKKVVSNCATVGIYHFARGNDFVRAAKTMIAQNLRVNGEFYVAPTYNLLIGEGKSVRTYDVGPLGVGMHGLGTPEDFIAFQNTSCFKREVAGK